VIRLDHQHLAEQLARREVPVRSLEALVGKAVGRLVLAVVVVHLIGRHEDRPSMTTALLAARIGTGQRTTLAAIRRYRCPLITRFGSKSPKRLPTVKMAGPNVSAAEMVNSMAMATAGPMVWK